MQIRHNWLTFLATIVLFTLLAVAPMYGQVLYGSITGTVEDSSGAVMTNTTVTLANEATGQIRETKSDDSGRFNFADVLPGTYTLRYAANGFRTLTRKSIGVSANTAIRQDAQLELGAVSDQITVEASTAALQTEKSDTHSEITAKAVQNIPLGGYRNYQSLINLVPGAMPAATQNSITDTPGRALRTNINGGNAQTNITRIDGATSVNVWLPHHVGYVAPSETVETVNVTTSAADAEQGMSGSSAITVVTKSGTNDIHGSGFLFHDNQHLKARSYFQAAGTDNDVSIYNNFGATLGGAIVKNKLFYFLSYDATHSKSSTNGYFTVPTAAERAGDFSGSSTVIYDPLTGNSDGTGRQAFAGNIVPANRISSIAQAIQDYYPEANLDGTSNNYYATGGPILNRRYFDAKINYNRNDRHAIWGKYGRMWADAGGSGVFGVAGGDAVNGDPGTGDTLVQVATIGHSYTLSPTLLLDGVFGFQRMSQSVTGTDYGTNYGELLGIPNTNGSDIRQSGFPYIDIDGYSHLGVPSWMPAFRKDQTFTHSDNLTWIKGAHEFRFGFDVVRHHLNHWQPELSDGGPRGYLSFTTGTTALNEGTASSATSLANSYASFLLSNAYNVQKGLQYIDMTGREWQFGAYARDRWQVSRNLTVNIGLRYEYYPLMTRAGYGIERYDPTTNQIYMGGRGDVESSAGITVSKKLFAPRVGIAYRLGESTVIRSGYGINYDPIPFSRPLRGFYPLTINYSTSGINSYVAGSSLETGVPDVTGPDLSTGVVTLPGNASERSPWGGEIHRGYVQSWNFTVERKLPADWLMSLAYVGQKSTHLLADYNINYGTPGSGTEGLVYYSAYGRTTATSMWDGYLSSNYHSLQVAVNRQFTKGLMVKGAYTWSHAIDYTDDDGWASVGWNDPTQFERNRATAGFDRKHVLQAGWVYELPFGQTKALANKGVPAKVLGDWQLNGTVSAYTGTPFTVESDSTSLNDGGTNTQTANLVASSVTKFGNVGPGQYYYDPTAYAAVTAVAYGNSGRNVLRNPGVFTSNLSLVRVFPIKERFRLEFRGEAYNFTNTPQFGSPDGTVTSDTFMQITSASGERQLRFGLRASW